MIDILIMTYNSEKTIERCLNSVYNLNCKDFRVILLDDNSKDNTVALVKEKFPDVEIHVNETNIGSGKNRHHITEYVTDDYFMFLDSDDMIKINYIKVVNQIIEACHPDVIKTKQHVLHGSAEIKSIQYDLTHELPNKKLELIYKKRINHEIKYCTKYTKKEDIYRNLSTMYISNCVMKKDLLEGLIWYDQRNCEDGCMVSQISLKCNILVKTNYTEYYWDRSTNGISKHPNTAHQLLDILHAHLLGDSINKIQPMEKHLNNFINKMEEHHINKNIEYYKELEEIYKLYPDFDKYISKHSIKINKIQ